MNNPDLYYVKAKGVVWKDVVFQTPITGFEVQTRWVTLTMDGKLHIRAGYPWDFATGAFDTEDIIKASLPHDVFCEFINEGLLPKWLQPKVDKYFQDIEKLENMPWIRRVWTYTFVRLYQTLKKKAHIRKVYKV